jgi:hypothetical protein
MIKLFLSVTLATAFMGLVACEPTSTSSTTVKGTNQATRIPTTTTESTDTVTGTNEATETPTSSTTVKRTNEATQTPTTTTESTDTVTGTNEATDTPIVTTESTGNVTAESNGTVMEYTPGEVLTLKTDAGEPLRCKFGEIVSYVTSDGKVIDASKIRKDSKVRVLYHKDGDDMVVDKVIVTEVRD